MQTSSAVAAGFLNASGAETPSSPSPAATGPEAGGELDFEQYLQQTAADEPGCPAGADPRPPSPDNSEVSAAVTGDFNGTGRQFAWASTLVAGAVLPSSGESDEAEPQLPAEGAANRSTPNEPVLLDAAVAAALSVVALVAADPASAATPVPAGDACRENAEQEPKTPPATTTDAQTGAEGAIGLARRDGSRTSEFAAAREVPGSAVFAEAPTGRTTGEPARPTDGDRTVVDPAATATSPAGSRSLGHEERIARPILPARDSAAADPRVVNGPEGNVSTAEKGRAPSRAMDQFAPRNPEVARFQTAVTEIPEPLLMPRPGLMPSRGTAAAKLERSMDKRLEPNEFAATPEQKLPGHGGVPGARVPGGSQGAQAVRDALTQRPDSALRTPGEPMTGGPAQVPGFTPSASVAGPESSAGVAGATRTAEQLLQNLTREVAQFKRFNAESMAVVLKPDGQTEILLHVVSRQGQIDIQARFERGDFAALNGQWANLQQVLANQGVKLGSLQDNFNPSQQQHGGSADWGHGQMNEGQQRPDGRTAGESRREAFEESRLVARRDTGRLVPRERTSAPVRANAALEAWA